MKQISPSNAISCSTKYVQHVALIFIVFLSFFPTLVSGQNFRNTGGYREYDIVRETRQRAEKGDGEAQYNLGVMYAQGEGVKQDNEVAAKWYRKAAEQGVSKAQVSLGIAYNTGMGAVQNDTEALRWFRKAAEQGNALAQFSLGMAHNEGTGGLPKNDTEAVEWYKKAAEQGFALAQSNLGFMYANGQGVPRDYELAHMWLTVAASQQTESLKNLQPLDSVIKQIELRMVPDKITSAQRMAIRCLESKYKNCDYN